MTSKTIIVTGAAGGIGRAIAIASGQRGWNVAALDIDEPGARSVAREAEAKGAPKALGILCDVSDETSVHRAFELAASELGVPQGIVANAGIEINVPTAEMDLDRWNQVISVNLTGVFLTVREAIRQLIASDLQGSIICTSSPSAFVGFAGGGNAAYGSSKGGVSALVRSVAIDYAHRGIRVNGLVPGATDTPILLSGLSGEARRTRATEISRNAALQIPLGRLADPAEIASTAIWLLSDDSSYVTGSNLVCDGGLMSKSANDF